ncbi:MAG: Xaa-Pro dipeptidase [Pseudomonadales bacterium]|nr:Xaa-Pro dipeptidase [Pseudomonadales bacterium]
MKRHFDTSTPAFGQHLSAMAAEWQRALELEGLDAAVVTAGKATLHYSDDLGPPFRANPHFLRWVPFVECENSVLVVHPGARPQLFWWKPRDYWYLPLDPPEFVDGAFDVKVCPDTRAIARSVVSTLSNCRKIALVGPEALEATLDNRWDTAPKGLVQRLEYFRAYRTPFELNCMRESTRTAVKGHLAAREEFLCGGSEFTVHMAYLRASGQTEADLPYPNIVAINEHAGTLHYQRYERKRPSPTHSLLVDAGARHMGYHSDITRTYSFNAGHPLQELVQRLDEAQQELISNIKPGQQFAEQHECMRYKIAGILVEASIINCSQDSAIESGLVDAFFPHGLGHLLGLMTHEAGGHLSSEIGPANAPPPNRAYLRLTRTIEQGQVFTIEPGIYFIPMLLDPYRGSSELNWTSISRLMPAGGVRVEDNVFVRADGLENITRAAFDECDASS